MLFLITRRGGIFAHNAQAAKRTSGETGDQAAHVLAWLIDVGTWKTAADIAFWHKRHNKVATPLMVTRVAAFNRSRPDVALALTLGLKRAHLNPNRTVSTGAHDFVCVRDDATVLNMRDPTLCAELAIWFMYNGPPAVR